MNLIKKSVVLLTALASFSLTSCGGSIHLSKEAADKWVDEHIFSTPNGLEKVKSFRYEYDVSKHEGEEDKGEYAKALIIYFTETLMSKVSSSETNTEDFWQYTKEGTDFKCGVSGNKWVTFKDGKDDKEVEYLSHSVDSINFKVTTGNANSIKGGITDDNAFLIDNKYLSIDPVQANEDIGYETLSLSINSNGVFNSIKITDDDGCKVVVRFTFASLSE